MCKINKLDPTQTCDRPPTRIVRTVATEEPVGLCSGCFSRRYNYRPVVVARNKEEKPDTDSHWWKLIGIKNS